MSNSLFSRVKSFFRPKPQALSAKFDLAQTTSENRKHWANADILSSRAALNPAVRRLVRMRSRHESENNSWYAGMLQTAANHVIGNGPRLQVLTDDPALNSLIETTWAHWAKKAAFADGLRLGFVTYWRDGEVFLFRGYRNRWYPLPLDYRLLEAEQVSAPWTHPDQQEYIEDGIIFDRNENELLYHIWRQHPGGNFSFIGSEGDWYLSDHVCHLYRAERPGQMRGIPRATPSLSVLPIMRRQEMATLTSAEIAASFSLFLKTNGAAVEAADSTTDFASMEIARGMLTTLPEGWDVTQLDTKHPGPQYESFQRQTLMSFSRCTQMPYCLAAGTSKDSNFSSMKGDLRQIWEPEVRVEQDRVEAKLVEPVFQWLLQDMHAARMLPADPRIAMVPHQWTWPPLPDVDPIDSANAAAMRVKTGLSSLSEEHGRRNLDWNTEASRAAADFGIPVETYKAAVFMSTFGLDATAVGTAPGQADAAPQGEYTEIGQRAFSNNQKRIRSTLEQFAAGELSQVMAEQTLATIGLSPERISALIEDASDGRIDNPSPMQARLLQAYSPDQPRDEGGRFGEGGGGGSSSGASSGSGKTGSSSEGRTKTQEKADKARAKAEEKRAEARQRREEADAKRAEADRASAEAERIANDGGDEDAANAAADAAHAAADDAEEAANDAEYAADDAEADAQAADDKAWQESVDTQELAEEEAYDAAWEARSDAHDAEYEASQDAADETAKVSQKREKQAARDEARAASAERKAADIERRAAGREQYANRVNESKAAATEARRQATESRTRAAEAASRAAAAQAKWQEMRDTYEEVSNRMMRERSAARDEITRKYNAMRREREATT